jgi:glycerophosphoryl diester phosphodiesterase
MLHLTDKTQKPQKPLIIGHRGAMGYETENTLASIQKALDLNVDMIEVDVFVLASGEVVVFHDETLERLGNATDSIEALSWNQVQQIRLVGNHKIPLLTDVLDLINGTVPLNIELKGKNTAKPVFEIIKKYQNQNAWNSADFMISSFQRDALMQIRSLDLKINLGVLTDQNPLEAIFFAQQIKAKCINPYWRTLTKSNCTQLHAAGFEIYTYTVNNVTDIQAVVGYGVDGIFTDFPNR